jgi:formamidopyrimidine-DNA glycosylase
VPELPEVESVRRQLAPALTGRRIVGAWWDAHPHARQSRVADAIGGTITAVNRRGKYLLCPLRFTGALKRELILHLGMSGALRVTGSHDDTSEQDPYDRAWLALDNHSTLRFRDPRRFGRISVVDAGDYAAASPTLAALGPEPLGTFDVAAFCAQVATMGTSIKAALLQQRIVAGVGNIYADEALWRARIHPLTRAISPQRARVLIDELRAVLSAAIEREGTTFRNYQMLNGQSGRYAAYLQVYGKHGQPCMRCGTRLERLTVAQRGTTFCPQCQPHPMSDTVTPT